MRKSFRAAIAGAVRGRLMHSAPLLPSATHDPAFLLCSVDILNFPLASAGMAQPLLQCPALPQLWQMMGLGPGDADAAVVAVPRPAILLGLFRDNPSN